MSYDKEFNATENNDQFNIFRPPIEPGLDGVLELSAVSDSSATHNQCSSALEVSRLDFYSVGPGTEWNKR